MTTVNQLVGGHVFGFGALTLTSISEPLMTLKHA